MEPHTNSSTPVSTPAREPSPILDGRRHGYHWVVIMVAASAFRFRVYDAYDEPVFVDADDYPHAGKAATAAEKWCEQEHAATGRDLVPLCRHHHGASHTMGATSFASMYRIDLRQEAHRIARELDARGYAGSEP